MEGMLKNTVSEKPRLRVKDIKKFLVPAWVAGSVITIGVLGFMLFKAKKPGGTTYGPQDIAGNPGITYKEGSKNSSEQQKQQQQLDPETQKIIDQVVARVKELAQLEGDATPDVARIANADSLREKDDSGFYENASDGDFVVKYPNVAFLYSPSEDKILKAAEIKPKSEPTQDQGE